jgi:hypothetical protein
MTIHYKYQVSATTEFPLFTNQRNLVSGPGSLGARQYFLIQNVLSLIYMQIFLLSD